tara:strand:+ start:1466 stop:1945 length:480 start_codon:yes stop_codon:yes gene_type:complete
MSVRSDIVAKIQSVDSSSSVSSSDITDSIISSAWERVCDSVQDENSDISDKSTGTTWSATEKRAYGIAHFRPDLQSAIISGKVTMPYKSDIVGHIRRVVYTQNKLYKFPTNNVNYFNSAVDNVSYYGAVSYFNSIQSNYETNATTVANAQVANYNYNTE